MFGSAESEHPRLTNGEIISEEFQPMCSVGSDFRSFDLRSRFKITLGDL